MIIKRLKGVVRNTPLFYKCYNGVNFLRNKLMLDPLKNYVLSDKFVDIKVNGYLNTFCGYYDLSPFSPMDNNLILIHANNVNPNTKPSSKYETTVGIFNVANRSFERIGTTRAWNWQQGARLQWIDEDTFAYNIYDFKEKVLNAKLVNIRTEKQLLLPMSIHSSYRGRFILSINFQDLTNYTEYGYPGTVIRNDSAGIDIFDIMNNSKREIININELFSFFPNENHRWINVHINHPQFSPNGSLIIFTFRFYIRNQRFDSLFCLNQETDELSLLIKNQLISHYSWVDENCILFWGIIDEVKGYYRLWLNNGALECIFLANNDGHPVPINSDSFITDTYPDTKNWIQKLHHYNILTGKRFDILSLPHPITPNSSSFRCDLHPSLSLDKTMFQIDSRFRNNRSIIIGKIPKL